MVKQPGLPGIATSREERKNHEVDYRKLTTHWVTRDGRKLTPREMSDAHLAATMGVIQRWHRTTVAAAREEFAGLAPPCCNGEYAQMAAEQSYADECDKLLAYIHGSTPGHLCPVYNVMETERARRENYLGKAWWLRARMPEGYPS